MFINLIYLKIASKNAIGKFNNVNIHYYNSLWFRKSIIANSI